MSQTGLPSLVEIEEKGEESFECPANIKEQLERAAFSQQSTTEFVKRRTSVIDGTERDVVRVHIEDEELRVEVEDIVGVVDLTPDSRLRIQPKIGWREILEMYIEVNDADRSIKHHGIPIDDFLSDDIDLDDIFIIVALNWYNSLKPLHSHGFLRSFKTRRYDAVSGQGTIDIPRSLQNFEEGRPKQHFVHKQANYSIPENELIHKAGSVLLRLFQKGSDTHQTPRYFEIFSDVRQEVDKLEQKGISSRGGLSQFRTVTTANLPRQRAYYRDAIQISKMILSSTSGTSLEKGGEELTVDYIINMESLFENFTQIVLEQELRKILDSPLYTTDATIKVGDKPTLPVFSDSHSNYQPDHVLYVDGDAAAVLDSKYYSAENDPSMFSGARTSMFAYAFLLETDKMAFLCPSGRPKTRPLQSRPGEVEVVTPNRTFTIERYRQKINEYLETLLQDEVTKAGALEDFTNYNVAHTDIEGSSVEEIATCDDLQIKYPGSFARKMLRAAAKQSNSIRGYRNISKSDKANLRGNFKNVLEETGECDAHIPLFLPADGPREVDLEGVEEWSGDVIKIYGVKLEGEKIEQLDDLGKYPLDWGSED